MIDHFGDNLVVVYVDAFGHKLLDRFAVHDLVAEGDSLRHDLVEDDAANGRHDQLAVCLGVAHADRSAQVEVAGGVGHSGLVKRAVDAPRRSALLESAEGAGLLLGHVVAAENDVQGRRDDGLTVGGVEQVFAGEHDLARLCNRCAGKWDVHGHLVAVEVGVEGGTDQRVDLDGAAVDEDGLKRLNTEAVKRRRAVKQHRAPLDHLVQDVPDFRTGALHEALGRLDVVGQAARDEAVHDERLEQLQGHLLGEAALVELEFRADDDDRAAGVVDALAEQVLAEAPLLALEHV